MWLDILEGTIRFPLYQKVRCWVTFYVAIIYTNKHPGEQGMNDPRDVFTLELGQ